MIGSLVSTLRMRAPARTADSMLLAMALLAWCVALLLPAYLPEGAIGRAPMRGVHVIVTGLLFGWLFNGWAAYANVFFLFAGLSLSKGRVPGKSVLFMLLLAATLPLFKGGPGEMGNHVRPLVSWGWGAFFWVWSLVLLAGATAARRRLIGTRGAWLLAAAMLFSGAVAQTMHVRQWRTMNETDRLALMPSGMVYAVSELCPVALAWPAPSEVAGGEPVVIDFDAQMAASYTEAYGLQLPGGFGQAQFDGAAWRSYAGLMVRQPAAPGTLVLQIKKTAGGAHLRLLKGVPQRVLYEQPLPAISTSRGHGLCPISEREPEARVRSDYAAALLRAMGQDQSMPARAALPRPELARERCDIGTADIDGIKGLRSLDGREVILSSPVNARLAAFCSARYIALAEDLSLASDPRMRARVLVLDRKSLQPLAAFDATRGCALPLCAPASFGSLAAIRLEAGGAMLETEAGEAPPGPERRP